jgi:hypothetical protein
MQMPLPRMRGCARGGMLQPAAVACHSRHTHMTRTLLPALRTARILHRCHISVAHVHTAAPCAVYTLACSLDWCSTGSRYPVSYITMEDRPKCLGMSTCSFICTHRWPACGGISAMPSNGARATRTPTEQHLAYISDQQDGDDCSRTLSLLASRRRRHDDFWQCCRLCVRPPASTAGGAQTSLLKCLCQDEYRLQVCQGLCPPLSSQCRCMQAGLQAWSSSTWQRK